MILSKIILYHLIREKKLTKQNVFNQIENQLSPTSDHLSLIDSSRWNTLILSIL